MRELRTEVEDSWTHRRGAAVGHRGPEGLYVGGGARNVTSTCVN